MNQRIIVGFFLALCVFDRATTEDEDGFCGNLMSKPDLDVTKLIGTWHIVECYGKGRGNLNGMVAVTVFERGAANTITVRNFPYAQINFRTRDHSGIIHNYDASERGMLRIGYKLEPGATFNYYTSIRETDYKTFIVIYECIDRIDENMETAWILTKKLNPDKEVLTKAETIVRGIGIDMVVVPKVEEEYSAEDRTYSDEDESDTAGDMSASDNRPNEIMEAETS